MTAVCKSSVVLSSTVEMATCRFRDLVTNQNYWHKNGLKYLTYGSNSAFDSITITHIVFSDECKTQTIFFVMVKNRGYH